MPKERVQTGRQIVGARPEIDPKEKGIMKTIYDVVRGDAAHIVTTGKVHKKFLSSKTKVDEKSLIHYRIRAKDEKKAAERHGHLGTRIMTRLPKNYGKDSG